MNNYKKEIDDLIKKIDLRFKRFSLFINDDTSEIYNVLYNRYETLKKDNNMDNDMNTKLYLTRLMVFDEYELDVFDKYIVDSSNDKENNYIFLNRELKNKINESLELIKDSNSYVYDKFMKEYSKYLSEYENGIKECDKEDTNKLKSDLLVDDNIQLSLYTRDGCELALYISLYNLYYIDISIVLKTIDKMKKIDSLRRQIINKLSNGFNNKCFLDSYNKIVNEYDSKFIEYCNNVFSNIGMINLNVDIDVYPEYTEKLNRYVEEVFPIIDDNEKLITECVNNINNDSVSIFDLIGMENNILNLSEENIDKEFYDKLLNLYYQKLYIMIQYDKYSGKGLVNYNKLSNISKLKLEEILISKLGKSSSEEKNKYLVNGFEKMITNDEFELFEYAKNRGFNAAISENNNTNDEIFQIINSKNIFNYRFKKVVNKFIISSVDKDNIVDMLGEDTKVKNFYPMSDGTFLVNVDDIHYYLFGRFNSNVCYELDSRGSAYHFFDRDGCIIVESRKKGHKAGMVNRSNVHQILKPKYSKVSQCSGKIVSFPSIEYDYSDDIYDYYPDNYDYYDLNGRFIIKGDYKIKSTYNDRYVVLFNPHSNYEGYLIYDLQKGKLLKYNRNIYFSNILLNDNNEMLILDSKNKEWLRIYDGILNCQLFDSDYYINFKNTNFDNKSAIRDLQVVCKDKKYGVMQNDKLIIPCVLDMKPIASNDGMYFISTKSYTLDNSSFDDILDNMTPGNCMYYLSYEKIIKLVNEFAYKVTQKVIMEAYKSNMGELESKKTR